MRYSLIIFDFDGTLADSFTRTLEIYHRIAPNLGLRPIDDVELARSMPTRQLLKHLGVRFWRLPRVVRAFHAAAAEQAESLKLHPGIVNVIEGLNNRGHRLGILSSNREETIRTCLRANGIEPFFSFVIGYPKLFGKAKALRKILKCEQIDRDEVLYVGDELRDLEAGRKARVSTAAVTWGFQAEPLLKDGGAHFLLREPSELLSLTEQV